MYPTEKNGVEAPPHWVYFTYGLPLSHSFFCCLKSIFLLSWAVGLFLYQTLDAIDGYVFATSSKKLENDGCPSEGNKPEGLEWQALWGKCLTMVRWVMVMYISLNLHFNSCQVATHSTQQLALCHVSCGILIYSVISVGMHFGVKSSGTRTFMVDCCLTDRYSREFLLDNLGRISHGFVAFSSSFRYNRPMSDSS